MTVDEALNYLKELKAAGYGGSIIRAYSELSGDPYPPVKFIFHAAIDNRHKHPDMYGDWIEVD